MNSMLTLCQNVPLTTLEEGQIVMMENERSDQLVVLAEGHLEVYRDDVSIALVNEPGAIFGEMSVLLNRPHTASVRATTPAKVHIVEDAQAFLLANPACVLPIAYLLARRLHNSTTYLVDMKRQFQDQADHFGMVDEVLESLAHEQDEVFTPDPELPADPTK